MGSFKRATKEQARLRMALLGPAGSGKTYTGLRIAQALAGGGKVAVIDSERGSASKYAHKFTFDVCQLETYSPETYVKAIHDAEAEGYSVLLIDGLSHAWMGKDGALEQVDKQAAKDTRGNSFAAWRSVTPMHNALVDAMLQSPCHIIATMRVKMEYVLEENEKGKKVPRKVGLQPVQRDGLEYEFDVVADLNTDHKMIVGKTRCETLDGQVFDKPGEDVAKVLAAWLTDGAIPAPKPSASAPVSSDSPKLALTRRLAEWLNTATDDPAFRDRVSEVTAWAGFGGGRITDDQAAALLKIVQAHIDDGVSPETALKAVTA